MLSRMARNLGDCATWAKKCVSYIFISRADFLGDLIFGTNKGTGVGKSIGCPQDKGHVTKNSQDIHKTTVVIDLRGEQEVGI